MTTGRNRLDQIERGLDGVTAGPWELREYKGRSYVAGPSEVVDGGDVICEVIYSDRTFAEDNANMRHFHRCSPDAIREIAAYVSETEARATAAEATVTALQEALAKAAEALERIAAAAERIDTYYAEETGNQTPLDNGVIISTLIIGDELSLFLLGDLRRARAALSQIRSEK